MKFLRSLLLLAACIGLAGGLQGQTKAVTKSVTGDALTENLTVPSGKTVTFAAGSAISLPDNALAIGDVSGLQAALDAKAAADLSNVPPTAQLVVDGITVDSTGVRLADGANPGYILQNSDGPVISKDDPADYQVRFPSASGTLALNDLSNVSDPAAARAAIKALEKPADDFASVVKFSAWGDSLTVGTGQTSTGGYPGALSTLNGITIYNGGVGGETSTQIKARMLAATTRYTNSAFLWAGRNNIAAQATIEADIAEMVAALGHGRYLVFSVLPSTADGSTQLAQVAAINAALSATYGTRYVDIVSYLQSDAAFTAAGLTKTAQDNTDVANGFIPASWRSDAVHLNDAGYTAVARRVQTAWVSTLEAVKLIGAMLAAVGEIGGVVPGVVKATKISAGAASDTTARLSLLGGSGGGPLAEYRRTSGTTVTFELSLSGGGYSLKDAVSGFIVQTLMGDGNINQLYIGERGRSSATTRVSRIAATSHSASAGTNVAGTRLELVGGLGTGSGTPGDVRIVVGTALASGSTAQAGDINALTVKGGTGTVQAYSRLEAGSVVKTAVYTVATLPSGQTGDRAAVSDASSPSWNSVVVGGGSTFCSVIYDGTNWRCGG